MIYTISIKNKFLFFTYWKRYKAKSHRIVTHFKEQGFDNVIAPMLEIVLENDETITITHICDRDHKFCSQFTRNFYHNYLMQQSFTNS